MMESSHILLAPSVTAGDGDEEGIPNVVKEAMAVGLPVVSTVHAGIPELVVDGESGFLVPERSVDDLAERIMYLCDHPEIWPQMSRAARRKVETEFDIGRLSMDLIALYAASIKQHGEHPPTSGYASPVATESAAIARFGKAAAYIGPTGHSATDMCGMRIIGIKSRRYQRLSMVAFRTAGPMGAGC
jgi:colanic acid/amylovoran biosynthesis glycosyltransferase